MKTPVSTFSILFVLALLVALGIGAYLFFQDIYRFFASLDQQVAAIVAAILIASLFIALSIRRAGKMSGVRRLGVEKKAEIYRQLIRRWSESRVQPNSGSASHKVSEDLPEVEHQLVLWASTAVLKHFVAYRRMDPQISLNDSVKRSVIEKMLREMRRDLGHPQLDASVAGPIRGASSSSPISGIVFAVSLYRIALWREMTSSPLTTARRLMISLVRPSAKYSSS